MRPALQSHLTVVERGAAIYPYAYAFKVPRVSRTGAVEAWLPITYTQFRDDVNNFAQYWTGALHSAGVRRKSVVALWLQGISYIDVVHVLAVSRAGYVPLLLWCPINPFIIVDLLRRGNAQALIYDGSYAAHLPSLPIQVFLAVDVRRVEVQNIPLPSVSGDADKLAFVLHTKGVTQGVPKLVPFTFGHLDHLLRRAQAMCTPINSSVRQDVYTWRCCLGYGSSLFLLLAALTHGSCLVQPTRSDFTPTELVDMVTRAGVNRVHRTTSHLSGIIREAKRDRNIAQVLAGLDEIVQTRGMLEREDEEWLVKNGISVSTIFSTTELPAILTTNKAAGSLSLLRPLDGVGAKFIPLFAEPRTSSAYGNVNTRVLELVISPDSPYCPDRTLRHSDGYFHTGDLFLEVAPGSYVFRGRVHDWIQGDNGHYFDAKVIEDNVRRTCGDITAECVVVGNGRPSPALLVEAAGAWDAEWIKKEIIRRTRHFQSKRLAHERIASAQLVVVIAGPNMWPRTPLGGIRRKDVEEAFRADLDRLYAAAPRT